MNLGPRYAVAELLLVPPPIELCAQPVVIVRSIMLQV